MTDETTAAVEQQQPPQSFIEAISILTESQKELLIKLYCKLDQKHLFPEEEFNVTCPPSLRKKLAEQLENLHKSYKYGTDGLEDYINNARKLLDDSKNNVNPLDGWKPSIPTFGEFFELGTNHYKEMENFGLSEMGSIGFVLVAGGLGERLGYSGIKLALPTEMTTMTCYLQYYIEYILAVQNKYANNSNNNNPNDNNNNTIQKKKKKKKLLPLCIMTSNDTNNKTIELLEKNDYFGMDKSQITIVQQGYGVPALINNQAHIAVSKDKWYQVITKPHGHGDIHELLYTHNVAKTWLNEYNIKYITLFQDTNGLAFHTLPVMLGVTKKYNLTMNSLTVPRKAKQAIGGITKLTNIKTNKTRTINVEYNQLDPLLRANGYPDGDVNDKKTGYSPFPGNINQLLFKLDKYVEILDRTKGLMPEFVNPKYTDETKTTFKKPTRLECMMQDFPTVLNEDELVGYTSTTANLCFSPVKNATEDGVQLQKTGTQPGTAATGEADQYAAQRKIMNSIGCNVETAKKETYLGIEVHPGAAIVLKPNFVCCPSEYETKFPFPTAIKISARSTLVVRGTNVVIESLDLDGTLIIDYKDNDTECIIRDKVVQNNGWVRIKDEKNTSDEIIKMRGYRIVPKETIKMEPPKSACIIS